MILRVINQMLTFGVVIDHFDLLWSILDEKEVGMFIIINLSALVFFFSRFGELCNYKR